MNSNLKSIQFHSSYGFKTTCRKNYNIIYEGKLSEIPNNLLEELKITPTNGKYIILYTIKNESK